MNRKLSLLALLLVACGAFSFAADSSAEHKPVGGGCDGCDLMFEGMPKTLHSETTILGADGGEPMEIEGVIYQEDGKTPAPDVILYVYHTDPSGLYSAAPEQTAARRHGRLRGWMKTDAQGHYKFRTTRPAPYPGRTNPAHIHPIVKEPDRNEYYLDEYLFDDDPLLTKDKRDAQEGRGRSGIMRLTRNADGVWMGWRDIILGWNIPDYNN